MSTNPPPNFSVVPLTFREVRFCNFYLNHGNATQAARDAGYTSASDGALRYLACKLLAKPNVAEYLREAIEHYLDAEQVTRAKIAQALAFEAFADRTAIFDAAGDVLPPRDWPLNLCGLIVSLDITHMIDPRTGKVTSQRYKVKFASPTVAKKVLAQWRGQIGAKATAKQGGADGFGVTVVLEAEKQ